MKLICHNCGNDRTGTAPVGSDRLFLFIQPDDSIVAVHSETKEEFNVPYREVVNSSFDCPICGEKQSVRLAIQSVI